MDCPQIGPLNGSHISTTKDLTFFFKNPLNFEKGDVYKKNTIGLNFIILGREGV